jgi:hypothetical protein
MKSQKNKRGITRKSSTTSNTRGRTRVSGKIISYDGGEASLIRSRDFSAVEDSSNAVAIIGSIAAAAGKSAASEARALGMPKVYASATKVIMETADGKKTVIDTADNIPGKKYFKKYTPGTVMHAIDK